MKRASTNWTARFSIRLRLLQLRLRQIQSKNEDQDVSLGRDKLHKKEHGEKI